MRSIDVSSVTNSKHDHLTIYVIDPVQDAICSTSGAPDSFQFASQRRTDSPRILEERSGDEVDNGEGNGLR